MRRKAFTLAKAHGGRSLGRKALVAATLAFAIASPLAAPAQVYGDAFTGSLSSVEAAQVSASSKNVVDVTFNDGVQGKITFLEDGIFRYNVDPTGEFSAYAAARSENHVARIQAQPDTSDAYAKPSATVKDAGSAFEISAGNVTVVLEKATGKLSIKAGDKLVMQESAPLEIGADATVQRVVKNEGENYFGGGTQNGRFIHTGNSINIVNEGSWVDGGVASPNPFYWSTDGYGVLRNTFAEGKYDFGKTDANGVLATHNDSEFDAYYFVTADDAVTDVAQDILREYYDVTGDPVLLPEYSFYLGKLNAYNRDGWSKDQQSGGKAWTLVDALTGEQHTTYEYGRGAGYVVPETLSAETLNGYGPTVSADNFKAKDTPYEFSARAVIDRYADHDMPFGWILPNDGYGAGYGQNGLGMTGGVDEQGNSSKERLAAVEANVNNLRDFTKYANDHGVETGLWTQSDLTISSDPSIEWQLLRDFDAEVKTGGITALKTDVAWVGPGYSFSLDGTKQAYDIVTTGVGKRPNIVTLCGWAGTQRFGGIWTGDQYGGDWEYIRFHIPTYIGQSLSGNPNIGSDMDAIYAGGPVVATRDYQWKTFSTLMLDMDGWGDYVKSPYTHGDPYTGISRMYLKLKSQLMPYLYTTAASAANIDTGNGDTGLPMVRAMLLEEESDYTESTATQYQYMFGESFLVAPVYEDVNCDEDGNDVRNGIFLPGTENDIWIDYLTGDQYRGGQVLNNFDAPLWKLPVFVKANAIVPMYESNNNPQAQSESNPQGLDKTTRITEFFAINGENTYTGYEDDGSTVENVQDKSDEEYGAQSSISYGDHVSTVYRSAVDGDTATFTIDASTGSYEGYDSNRSSTFVVNMSGEPEAVVAKNGAAELAIEKVASKEAFDAAEPADGKAVYFYDEAPNLNYNAYAEDEDVRNEAFSSQKITTTPKLYVKFAKTDVAKNAQTLKVTGFDNTGELPNESENADLEAPVITPVEDNITPTSIEIAWNAVDGATAYDLMVDGRTGVAFDKTGFTHTGLAYDSTHTYKVRARNAEGVSAWSEVATVKTAQDPWRNVPVPVSAKLDGGPWGGYEETYAFDHKTASSAGCLLSGEYNGSANGTGRALNLDYGKAFTFERLEYWPSAFGYVNELKIEYSLDGHHWSDAGTFTLEGDRETMKPIEFDEPIVGRYFRLMGVKCTSYWTAAELCFYKPEGSKGFAVGSLSGSETCTGMDYGNLGQVLGMENRGGEEDMFAARVSNFHLDLNGNGAYDVYDLAHFMAGYDPSEKNAEVSGELKVTADRASVKAGDVVTVQLKAFGVQNANALGALVHFDDSKFEFVPSSIKASDKIAGMSNRSLAKTQYNDGVQSVNLAFINEGDKDFYSGDDVVATFQLKAKADTKVELDSSTWTLGALLDFTTGSFAASLDKAALTELVEAIKAENLKAEDYTVSTWTPFAQALADAERLLGTDDTTQETIDQCVTALQTAYDNLEKTSVAPSDKPTHEQLGALIEAAKKLDTAGKTEQSVAALNDAIAIAEGVYGDEAATDQQIKEAYDGLKDAMDNLVDAAELEAAHKQLADLVAKAEKADTAGKTAATVHALEDALAAAKAVLANDNATVAELNNAYTALKAALDGLKDEGSVPPSDANKPGANGGLAQTGDASLIMVAGSAAAGIAAMAAGAAALKKNRRR